MSYKKCHQAIKDNATNQDCLELLKLIGQAEKLHLYFIFAYHKTFMPLLPNEQIKEMDYIEVVSERLLKRYGVRVSIIKNNSDITVTFHDLPNTIKLDKRGIKNFYKDIEAVYQMAELLKGFNMKKLPII